MNAPDQNGIRLRDLEFRVGEVAILRALNVDIRATERTVVLGPNGAGKSVLLRLIHGLLQASLGEVILGAQAQLRQQAMVFQRPVMLRRTVLENVIFAARCTEQAADPRARAIEALAMVGLAQIAHKPARQCSGGEQQRIALARAWVRRPKWILLDEPCASLDPTATRNVERIVRDMHAQGTSILMSTHDLEQARRLADRILFLHRGRLIEDLPTQDFFDNPTSKLTKAFLKGELLWD
jgi:tungstate transport system ATP-binding protein